MKEYKYNDYSIIVYCSLASIIDKDWFKYIFSQIIDNNREIIVSKNSLIQATPYPIDKEFFKLQYPCLRNQLLSVYYKKDKYYCPIISNIDLFTEDGKEYIKLKTHPYFTNTARNKFLEDFINEEK